MSNLKVVKNPLRYVRQKLKNFFVKPNICCFDILFFVGLKEMS